MSEKASIVLMACILLFLFFHHASAIDISPGTTAPEFSLESIEGKAVSLNQYKDSVVLLIYWWPGQPRSLLALKDGQDILRQFKEKGVRVIGLTADADHAVTIQKVIKKNNIDFPVLMDSERQVFGDYGIHVYPSTVLIDKRGQITYTLAGHALTYKKSLEGHIQYILGEIDEETMHQMVSPRNEHTEESLLIAHSEYNLALKLTEEQLFDLAAEAVKRSIKARTDIAEPHVLMGFLYLQGNEPDKAMAEFNEALKLNTHSHDAKTGLGSTLILKGEIDKAVDILQDALRINPHPQMTYYELGRAYELKGELNKALEMYKQAIEKIVDKTILPSHLSRFR